MIGAHRFLLEVIECDLCGLEAPESGLRDAARLDWLRFQGWRVFTITWPPGKPAAGYHSIRTICPDCTEAIRKGC